MEFPSALKAVPASPIPPALESGVIAINGTAVVIVFNCKSLSDTPLPVVGCAQTTRVKNENENPKMPFFVMFLIKSKFCVESKYTLNEHYYCILSAIIPIFLIFLLFVRQ